jgi:pimeloyl-ACP methyl ester carboxylesterase
VEPPIPGLTPGRRIDLPGRGRSWVRDLPGPTTNAPAVLLLHGWTATADLNWATSYKALQKHFRVVAVDHRGHGRGLRSSRPFRLSDCADDAAAVCRALDIDQVVATGYSMGGPVAQLLWRRHPDLVSGLVLCATAARFTDGSARIRFAGAGLMAAAVPFRMARPFSAPLLRMYANGKVSSDARTAWAVEQIRRHDPATVMQAGAAITNYDATRWLGEVDVPTVVVLTEHDNLVPAVRQRRMADLIPGASVLPIPADHSAPLDAVRTFVPALVDAVTEVAGRVAIRERVARPAS